ncbi:hypothetical protein ABEB36_011144 [Hypothenemus hampei]|uniref:Uncharacterized protein n=1 Tax=Hypothenemus hampei TaxID=57062 RepID=A0ABD1EEE7_HYPHA
MRNRKTSSKGCKRIKKDRIRRKRSASVISCNTRIGGSYLSEIEETRENLRQPKEEINDKIFITKILILRENLKHFTSAWNSISQGKENLFELTSRLLIKEEKLKQTVTALNITIRYVQKGELKCFARNKVGHIKRQIDETLNQKAVGLEEIILQQRVSLDI